MNSRFFFCMAPYQAAQYFAPWHRGRRSQVLQHGVLVPCFGQRGSHPHTGPAPRKYGTMVTNAILFMKHDSMAANTIPLQRNKPRPTGVDSHAFSSSYLTLTTPLSIFLLQLILASNPSKLVSLIRGFLNPPTLVPRGKIPHSLCLLSD
jgi:hypothetical protein